MVFKVLLSRHLDFLERSKQWFCCPIWSFQKCRALFQRWRCFSPCCLYRSIFCLIFFTLHAIFGVWEKDTSWWLWLTQGHRLQQDDFFAVRFVDWPWYFSIFLHEHFSDHVPGWILLIWATLVIGWCGVLDSHQFCLLRGHYLARMRRSKRMRVASSLLRPCFIIEILTIVIMAICSKCCSMAKRSDFLLIYERRFVAFRVKASSLVNGFFFDAGLLVNHIVIDQILIVIIIYVVLIIIIAILSIIEKLIMICFIATSERAIIIISSIIVDLWMIIQIITCTFIILNSSSSQSRAHLIRVNLVSDLVQAGPISVLWGWRFHRKVIIYLLLTSTATWVLFKLFNACTLTSVLACVREGWLAIFASICCISTHTIAVLVIVDSWLNTHSLHWALITFWAESAFATTLGLSLHHFDIWVAIHIAILIGNLLLVYEWRNHSLLLLWVAVQAWGLSLLTSIVTLHLPSDLLVFLRRDSLCHLWIWWHIVCHFIGLRQLLGTNLRQNLSSLIVNHLTYHYLVLLLRDLLWQRNSVQTVRTSNWYSFDRFFATCTAFTCLVGLIEDQSSLIIAKLGWKLLRMANMRLWRMHGSWIVHFLVHTNTVVADLFLVADVWAYPSLVKCTRW